MMRSKCCLEKGCYFDLVKSSRLLHEEGQFKKCRVMELERIIRGDMRLYTIRQNGTSRNSKEQNLYVGMREK